MKKPIDLDKQIEPIDDKVNLLETVYPHQIKGAPRAALTAQSGSIATGSVGSFVTAASAATIENAITRIGELEDRLQELGLLK